MAMFELFGVSTLFKLQRLDHLVLITADSQRCLEFYIGVLGCELERTVEEIPLYQLRAGEALIDIRESATRPVDRNLDHFCLQVSPFNSEQIISYLDSKGVCHGGVEKRYGASGYGRSIYLSDPDGNTIELKET